MLLSYILPVYNTQAFLVKCLDSIAAQKIPLSEYEIIVVNDGSTDGSKNVWEKWYSAHPEINVQYIEQQNGGLSSSRNAGIVKAEGKYIWFVDSDDYLMPGVTDKILKEVQDYDLDVIWFDHNLVNLDNEKLPKPEEDIKTGISENITNGLDFLTSNFKSSCMVWAFVIRKSLITDHNIYFLKGIYFEDMVFTPQIIFHSEKIKYLHICALNYVIHSNSIMRNTGTQNKRIMDSLIVVRKLKDFSEKENNASLYHYIDVFTGAVLLYNYRLAVSSGNKNLLISFKNSMKDYHLYPFKINNPPQRKWLAKVANLSPYIFEKLSQLRPIK